MKTLCSLVALGLLFACGGAVDPVTDVTLSAPAVLVGGVVEPLPAVLPSSHDLEISDGTTDYRVMFGKIRSGQAIADRITAVTGATITASVDAEGRLVLTTVETGPGAELTVLRGAALPMLGLERGTINGF